MTMVQERFPASDIDPHEPRSPRPVPHIGQLSLMGELAQRGDRQLPDEPNRGFVIERLEGAKPHEPAPIERAIPTSTSVRAEDFAERFLNGQISTKLVKDAWGEAGPLEPSFTVYFEVPATKYEMAVAAGAVQTGLFGEDGKVSHVAPGAEALANLVDEDHKRAAIEKYYGSQEKMVQKGYVDELASLSDEARKELPGLLEAYDFIDGGKDIRLLNLSNTRLSDGQLRKVTNVLRSFSDKSGGELYDKLRTIVIVPEYNPAIMKEGEDEQGKFDVPYQGESKWDEQTLVLSERAVQRPEDRKPRSDRVEAYWNRRYNTKLLPGEPAEGQGSPKYNVAQWDIERLMAHELEHITLPPNDVPLEGAGPTLYSRFNKREHEAELGALEYIGWKDADAALDVPEDERQAKIENWEQQRAAKQAMWNKLRGTNDGGQLYEAPLGPRFVTCRELDVTKVLPPRPKYFNTPDGSSPASVKYHALPLLTEINYRLKPEE